MKKFIRKIIAGIMVGVLAVISSVNAISASAATIGNNISSSSAFTYTVITEKVTYNGNSNAIKMTVRTVNNPGVHVLAFGVEYDGNYDVVAHDVNVGTDGTVFNAE